MWFLGVFAFIFRDGRILVVRAKGQDHWSLPGGRLEIADQVEAAETGCNPFEVAIRREVLEETGMNVISVEADTAIPRLAAKWQDCALSFFIRAVGDPKPLSEIEEIRWISDSELPELKLFPRIREMISFAFRARRFFGE
ncbi:MAG: NUDIX domain-containing protein [Candidatus Pacebacteria bacterium]|nr:NUDIX domain-containing protein [Candidatus Paceibacterota bacterium]